MIKSRTMQKKEDFLSIVRDLFMIESLSYLLFRQLHNTLNMRRLREEIYWFYVL